MDDGTGWIPPRHILNPETGTATGTIHVRCKYYQYFSIYLNISQYFSIFLNISYYFHYYQYFSIFHNISQYFTIFLNISQYFSIFHNISQYFTIFLDISNLMSIWIFRLTEFPFVCGNRDQPETMVIR